MTRTTKDALADLYSAGRLIDVDLSRSRPLVDEHTAEVD